LDEGIDELAGLSGCLPTHFDAVRLIQRHWLTGHDGQALQNAVERLSQYVTTLEEKMETLERRKK
jgi:hypothetical protein